MTYGPTGGAKALTSGKPSRADIARLERRVQVIRNRYERWLRGQYRTMLRNLRDALADAMSQEGIDDALRGFDEDQRRALRRCYSEIYPLAASLVVDDDTLKAWNEGLETKAQDELDARIRNWIEEAIGVNISLITESMREKVLKFYKESRGDPVAFMEALKGSGLFSDVRARRIAVTETTIGINRCVSETAHEYSHGRRLVKTWHTTGGWNVRDSHRAMDGKTVEDGELFRVPRDDGGEDLMEFPGDSTHGASPGNVVNCHCMVFYSYMD